MKRIRYLERRKPHTQSPGRTPGLPWRGWGKAACPGEGPAGLRVPPGKVMAALPTDQGEGVSKEPAFLPSYRVPAAYGKYTKLSICQGRLTVRTLTKKSPILGGLTEKRFIFH